MKFNFDEIINRRGTSSAKWDAGQDGNPQSTDCIPMWVADMDFSCPPCLLDAIHKKAEQRIFGYSSVPASYWQSVSSFYKRHHGIDVTKDDIVFTEGVVPAINIAVKALTGPDDEIIIQPPVYYPFFGAVTGNGRTLSENRLILHEDGSYTMDFEDLEKRAASPKCTAMILCSPHNPVGRVWTEEELRKVKEICSANGVLLICDEIHSDLIRGGYTHHCALSLFPEAKDLVVCTAPTKSFNIAGLGASHMFCRDPEKLEKLRAEAGRRNPNPFTAAAVTGAYNDGDEWLREMNSSVDGNFERLYSLCGRFFPEAVCTRTEGTYLAWIDVRAYVGEETKKLESDLYSECGIYLECGDAFGGKGFLRVNLACPRAYLDEAFGRMILKYRPEMPVGLLREDKDLERHYLEASEDPSRADSFADRMLGVARFIIARKTGKPEIPGESEEDRKERILACFGSAADFASFISLFTALINN